MNHIIMHSCLSAVVLCAAALSAPAQSFLDFADATVDAVQESQRQNAAPANVQQIFAKAKDAEKYYHKLNLCGFYTGMSAADAQALAKYYDLGNYQWSIDGDPVYKIHLSLYGVRSVTKGGNTFDDLAQAVANRVGSMKRDWDTGAYSLKTIDGYSASMSESSGFTMVDTKAQAAAERKAREEREAAERKAFEEAIPNAIPKLLADMVQIPGKNYKMGKYEVTQAQWEAVMGENPSYFKGANNPVECVSWNDVQEFLKKLNATPAVQKSGMTFRLPTEEEWEYACRAGATGDYCRLSDGTEITKETLGRVAWFHDNSDYKTHPVGQKKPNAFGLYDMHGNVWEWTSTAVGDLRVNRGGSWHVSARDCESSYRFRLGPSDGSDDLGIRLCASGRAD